MEEYSICRGKEYRKIVHIDDTFDAYRAPAIVWANESTQPILRLLIVGLSGLSFSGIFSLVTGVVSIYCSSLRLRDTLYYRKYKLNLNYAKEKFLS